MGRSFSSDINRGAQRPTFRGAFPASFRVARAQLSSILPRACAVVSSPSVDANSHNNGNVMGITNLVDGTRSQQFTYDQVNRIVTAETTSTYATSPAHCWGEAYVYDNSTTAPGEYGNLTNINVASTAYNGCTQESLSVAANTSNQLTAFSYDASGNVLNDTHNSYAWNAESEIKTAAGVTYTYDGDGNRLQKSNGKIYWYGAGSQVLDESDASGNVTDEYVYFGGKRVAHRVVNTNALYFYGEDMLGTSRTIFTSAGVLCYDADFYPFGGERAYTNTCPQNYKFESKERDSETNNDDFGARYYSSSFGRWTSPDWSAIPAPVPYANLTNPQTLNLYAMVRDNPETFADLDGHCDENHPCPNPAVMGGPIVIDPTSWSPRTTQIVLGVTMVVGAAYGIGEVAAAAATMEATSDAAVVSLAVKGTGAAAAFVSGATQVIGGATGQNTDAATKALAVISAPADLAAAKNLVTSPSTAIATPGGTVSAISTVQAVADGAHAAGPTASDVTSAIRGLMSTNPPAPKPSTPPAPPACASNPSKPC